jgi:SAM-dependent methyltransferase
MPPLDYLVLRLIRRHLPDRAIRALLGRGLIIRPGLETRAPQAASRRFLDALKTAGETITGRRVLIFGYGGRFEVAVELLRAGAGHVVLVDPCAAPLPTSKLGAEPAERLTIVNASLDSYVSSSGAPVDLVFSNSVMEHVGDVAETVKDLARATAPRGQHFHFIDLRDHFFRHPFEMLCYPERQWRRFLNPGSNLNRLRAGDYQRLFSQGFGQVKFDLLYSDLPAFRAARPRIRPEFLSGNDEQDAATHIMLRAARPLPAES